MAGHRSNQQGCGVSERWSVLLLMFQQKRVLHVFSITIHAYMFMRIRFKFKHISSNSIELHDGPGTRCKILSPVRQNENKVVFITSSFQSVVYFLHQHQDRLFQFFGQKLNVTAQKHTLKKGNKFFGHVINCQSDKLCMTEFETEDSFTLNVTLSHFEYKGENHKHDCSYGGVSLYSVAKSGHKYIDTVCVTEYRSWSYSHVLKNGLPLIGNISSNQYKFPKSTDTRVFYSKTNRLLLVWYSWKVYGSFRFKAFVKPMSCVNAQLTRRYNRGAYLMPWHRKCSFFQTNFSRVENKYFKFPEMRYGDEAQVIVSGILKGTLCSYYLVTDPLKT